MSIQSRLLVSAATFLLVSGCGSSGPSGPIEAISKFPADLRNAEVHASGIYDDGWVAEHAELDLSQSSGDLALSIRGMVPKVGDGSFHADVDVKVDSKTVAHQTIGVGDFNVSAALDPGAGKRHVTVDFSAFQTLPAGDGREVGGKLSFVGFESAAASGDILRSSSIRLGDGWGPAETFKGQTFRWIDNNAKLLVTPGKSGDFGIGLLVEPGPGIGGPFVLKALDSTGRQVAAVKVDKQTTVQLLVPAEADKVNEFTLHVDGGGKATQGDPRILNFRVLRVEAVPTAAKS